MRTKEQILFILNRKKRVLEDNKNAMLQNIIIVLEQLAKIQVEIDEIENKQ